MKKILFTGVITLSFFAANSFAADTISQPATQTAPKASIFSGAGPYVGVEGGYSEIFDTAPMVGGFGYRVYIGYNVMHFLSLEGGYSGYPEDEFSHIKLPGKDTNNTVSTSSWDVMIKGILPLNIFYPKVNLDLYMKLGLAYVVTDFQYWNKDDVEEHNWDPAYALGAEYHFNKYFSANIEWYGNFNHVAYEDGADENVVYNTIALGLIFKLPVVK